MRIDKYLWCVRIYKTRSIATEACKKGQVKMNDESIKPSKLIIPGDVFSVRKNQINYRFEILDIPKSRIGAKILNQYLNDKTPPEEFEKFELLKFSKDYYRKKGTGRPTKKDRRDLDDIQS